MDTTVATANVDDDGENDDDIYMSGKPSAHTHPSVYALHHCSGS